MKKVFYLGMIIGGITGIIIALSMDAILGGSLGSWREAVANDLRALFGINPGLNSPVVLIGVIVVIAFLGAFGAYKGGICGFIIVKLFSLLK